MNVGDRIANFRKAKKLTQVIFSKEISISQGSLSDIEKNKTEPSFITIQNIINRYTDINIEWLLTGKGDMFITKTVKNEEPVNTEETQEEFFARKNKEMIDFLSKNKANPLALSKYKPVYNNDDDDRESEFWDLEVVSEISAGIPIPCYTYDEPLHVVPVSKKILPYPYNYWCFRVNGDSMSPEIEHGDYVVLNKTFDTNSLDGKIVAVRNSDGLTLKRLILDTKNKCSFLFPVNKHHSHIILDEEHTIVGALKLIIRIYPD